MRLDHSDAAIVCASIMAPQLVTAWRRESLFPAKLRYAGTLFAQRSRI